MPNTGNNDDTTVEEPDNSPDPIDPPREPTETESELISLIGYSMSEAGGEIYSALTTAINDVLEKGLISGQLYNLKYSTDDISVNGTITINRPATSTTWKASISSYEITGTNNNIDYRLYGNAIITSEDESRYPLPFTSIKADIINYTGLNDGGWNGALITTGEIGQSGSETYFILNAEDEDGKPHTWKANMTKISDNVFEGTQSLDGANLILPTSDTDSSEPAESSPIEQPSYSDNI